MTKYILKRVLIALIILIGITIIDFEIMNAAGNPLEILAKQPKVSAKVIERKAEIYGLDKPKYEQYFIWLKNVLHGEFGYSYKSNQPVRDMIVSHLGPTLLIMGVSMVISLVIASILGIYSAVHQHSPSDYAVVSFAFLGQSIPSFFLSMLLIYIFSIKLHLLPFSGSKTLGVSDGIEIKYMIMPVIVLVFDTLGSNIRYIRSAMLEILEKDYLRTAKAKGIGRFKVINKHGLRNALIPIITIIGMQIPELFGGAVIVEQLFSWPGIGLLAMNAIMGRDYPVIMAVCLLSAVVVLAANLLTDIMYAVVNPTIKY
ncbi:MAG: ABC transporter permease [Lachnospiraceae bacterium]|nr:ABC transporter permease [Lachnospiraceae bacterium]